MLMGGSCPAVAVAVTAVPLAFNDRGFHMGKFHDLMDRELRIRGMSESTRESYLRNMRCFVKHFMRPPDDLGAEEVKRYQLHLAKNRQMAWGSFNQHVCAIRFFYRHVLDASWEVEQIPYQKTGRRLPVVLSRQEVAALVGAVTNLKHRAIVMVLYAAGLRVGEATRLRVGDIDSERMMIRVVQGKGRKDRYVMLSAKLLEALRRYWAKERPAGPWLFPGQAPGRALTRCSVTQLLADASKRAHIRKRVHPHTLRHSFATHLLERGVNVRVILRLLGHGSLRSTEIYTHVAETYVSDTRSPLDDLLPAVEGVGPSAE